MSDIDHFELLFNPKNVAVVGATASETKVGAMVVTNTKFSDHALRYGKCRNILQIGWSTPPNHGLQDLIEEKGLHPITCIKGLMKRIKDQLISDGIVLMKQLLEEEPKELAKRIRLSTKDLENIIEKAKTCAHTLRYPKIH